MLDASTIHSPNRTHDFKCSSQELKLQESLLTPETPLGRSEDGSIKLAVTLIQGAQILEADLAHWTTNLETILEKHGGGANLRHTSTRKVTIKVTVKDLKGLSKATKAAAIWLAKQKQVSWVEEAPHHTVKSLPLSLPEIRGRDSPASNEERISSKAHGAPALHQDTQLRNQNAVVTAQGGPDGTARLHQVMTCKRRT